MKFWISLSEAPYVHNPPSPMELKELASLIRSWVFARDRDLEFRVVDSQELLLSTPMSTIKEALEAHGWHEFKGDKLKFRMRPFSFTMVNVTRMLTIALTRFVAPGSEFKTMVRLSDKLKPEQVLTWPIEFPYLYAGVKK